jgi:hypothetical protein
MDSVHTSSTTASGQSTVDPHSGVNRKPPESGRYGAPACPCSPAVAGKEKGGVGDSPRGSPELGERRNGRATRVKWQRSWGSTRARSDVGEEDRGAVSGAGFSGAEVPFYKGWGRAPGDDNGWHQRRNGRRHEW